MRILICGSNSFVAKGLVGNLLQHGCIVETFNRGISGRKGNDVVGDVKSIHRNLFLNGDFDIVFNFIILKNCSVEENIEYLKSLLFFCKEHKVKKLVHLSSIVIHNSNSYINETSRITEDISKNLYTRIKNASEMYLRDNGNIFNSIDFVRLGFVIETDVDVPYIIKFPFSFYILKGSGKSVLPVIQKSRVHAGLISILSNLKTENSNYLFVSFPSISKQEYLNRLGIKKFIEIPEIIVILISRILYYFKWVSDGNLESIRNWYNTSSYDSSVTQRTLNIEF